MSSEYVVTMLGDFTVSHGQKTISDRQNRSRKPWNLIEYMFARRGESADQDDLLRLIWSDDTSDNSAGALKVLLHRARKILDELEPDDNEELIVLKKGEYYLNRNLTFVVDVDLFEQLCTRAEKRKNMATRTALLEEAVKIYKGDFLLNNQENWLIPTAEYYHNMYVKAVYSLIDCYLEVQNYDGIISTCTEAVKIDAHDEGLYFRLIDALYRSGHQAEALIAYNEVTEAFYRQFGITPSKELKSLYRTIIKTTKDLETDLNVIKDALTEEGEAVGAFSCEYEFFKDIYQLEARACARSGDSIYLGLITLSSAEETPKAKDSKAKADPAFAKALNKGMDDLVRAINDTLRKGDVYSRYSVSQYVLLLPSASYENVEMVMKRISSSFYRKHLRKDFTLSYRMLPLDPKA
ncbi:MAG: winged helix-turn-helix domain-containing protein [Lachnospiraceae bacterium]|nr:winged helix-turn-helix domain-containing protein [Lachnospiraceae bacterium]